MFSAWKIVKEAFTSGMRSANEKPSSIRVCFTDSTNGAMLILTAPSETSTASLVLPVSTATICSWAARVALTHASSNAWEVTTWSTRARTKFSMALLSGIAREGSTSPAREGTKSCPARAVSASLVISSTSMRVVISSVIRSPIAACTAGSEPRGATVCSNRSVSPIWSCAQVASTVSGASAAATTIRTTTMMERHHWRSRRDRTSATGAASRAASCSSSSRSLARRRSTSSGDSVTCSNLVTRLVLASPRMDELSGA